jgi:hypothetical protein
MLIEEGAAIKDNGTEHPTSLITFIIIVSSFSFFLLTITLSVLLQFKAFEYPLWYFLLASGYLLGNILTFLV